jgi:bifunctional non-homologous end joining protein LigD
LPSDEPPPQRAPLTPNSSRGDHPAETAQPSARERAAGHPELVLTNTEKVFWPDEGITKGDLLEYYEAVSDVLLPHLAGRPVVLVRYPDGVSGKSFYQWRLPEGAPSFMRSQELWDEEKQHRRGGTKAAFLIDSVLALLYVINLGCIPLHVLASREQNPEHCDFLTIDFDLGPRPMADAVRLALSLREVLDELGLPGYPKTSGQRGLHVLVALGPGVPFASAKLLSELLGRLIVARHPEICTMERRRDKRGDKLYLDTGQVGRSRTIVAPYSVRAHPGATVSTPLTWEELHLALDPSLFDIHSVVRRVAQLGDPMADLLDQTPNLQATLAKLASWTGR